MRAKARFFYFLLLIFFLQIVSVSVAAAAIRIMPLGDSITDGYIDVVTPAELRVGYRQKLYLDLIDQGYDVDFVGSLQSGQSASQSFDCDHEGHGGWDANEIRDEIYNWLIDNPADIVLLHIGTNDISAGDSPDVIASEVDQILDQIYQYDPQITVILARIINRMNDNQKTTDFNNLLPDMVDAHPNRDNIFIVNQEIALDYAIDMTDNVHPNMDGYNKMADVWFDALEQIPPVADFTADPISEVHPYTVNFTDQSIGIITSWSWDFGDGLGTSTQQNSSYIYNDPGTYTVSLTVIVPAGMDTETKIDYITVINSTDGDGITVVNSNDGGGGCFISTVTHGLCVDPHVKVPQEFRKHFLPTNFVARSFVDLYHTILRYFSTSHPFSLSLPTRPWCSNQKGLGKEEDLNPQ